MKKFLLFFGCMLSLYAGEIKIVQSHYDVSQTIENIREIVTSKGFTLFGIINHTKNAQMVNMEMSEAQVILFGNPKAGTKLMQEDILSALDLPLRVLVYRDSDMSVKVAFRDVSTLKRDFKLADEKHLEAMDKGLSAIIAKATR